MASASANNRSVARRLTALSIALVAVVLALVGAAISVLTERSTRTQVVQSVADTTQSVANALNAADATNRELVQRTMKGFQRYFDANMELDEASGELRSFGALVNDDHGSVDRFANETGGVARVYVRQGTGFSSITSSVKDAQGAREGPQALAGAPLAAAQAGQPWVGRSVVAGKPYMGYYLPVQDAGKKTIALLFIGNDIGVMEEMQQKQVAQTHFFAHGGAYVIDPRGGPDQAVLVAHPTAAGKPVLAAYPQAGPFLEALAKAPDGYVRQATSLLDNAAREPWALMRKTGPEGLWVVAEVPDAEAMAGQRPVLVAVWGLIALAVVLLGAGLFVMLRRGVSRPLRQLTQAVTLVAQGDLTQPFHTAQRDEIGAAGEHDGVGVVGGGNAADRDDGDTGVVTDPFGERGLVATAVVGPLVGDDLTGRHVDHIGAVRGQCPADLDGVGDGLPAGCVVDRGDADEQRARPHRADGVEDHAELAQRPDQVEPGHGGGVVAPVAARGTVRLGQNTLVGPEADGPRGHPRAAGELPDGQRGHGESLDLPVGGRSSLLSAAATLAA